MSMQHLAGPAVRAVVVVGVGLAIIAPSAGARPITDGPLQAHAPARQHIVSPSGQRHESRPAPAPQVSRLIRGDLGVIHDTVAPRPIRGDLGVINDTVTPDQTSARPTPPAEPGGFDWVTAAIGGAMFAALLGLIWLGAVASGRVTRTRVAR